MNWLNPALLTPPQQSDFPTLADFIVAYGVHSDLVNASYNFLTSANPQYANPQAYLAAKIQDAVNVPKFSNAFAPPGWNAVQSGINAVLGPKGAFDMLRQFPVNAGDEKTISIYDSWVAKTGELYGGHAPIPPAGANSGVSAGAPQPGQTGNVTILGQPE